MKNGKWKMKILKSNGVLLKREFWRGELREP
jgi:hypothetical protein